MMWETTLKRITEKSAMQAASKWFDQPLNFKLINNQINCVYRFEYNKVGYYLRMTHEEIRSRKDLVASFHYQQHLILNDAPICQAITSKNGEFIENVLQDDLTFLANVCLEVPGNVMTFNETDQKVYVAWGKALAKLHRASQSYQPSQHEFRTWKTLWKETEEYLENEDKEIIATYQAIDAYFKDLKQDKFNFGLTHGDHRAGNVLYDGEQVNIIDFDEPVYHWFMADIAKPFLDLSDKPFDEWKQRFEWYIEGYRTVFPIDDNALKSINWFTQMKSLDIYLWCKNNWFEATAPGGKPREQWLNELKKMAVTPMF